MNETKDLYHVAVKILLRNNNQLLLTHDIFCEWDIPGGRIKPDEFEVALEDVIARKMREELGADVVYVLGQPKVFFRHERIEYNSKEKARIFAIGYEADYVSGDIQLGGNHDRFEWVDIATCKPEEYLTGGWLKGLNEYLEIARKA